MDCKLFSIIWILYIIPLPGHLHRGNICQCYPCRSRAIWLQTGCSIMSVSHTPKLGLEKTGDIELGAAHLVQYYSVFSSRPSLGYGTLIQCTLGSLPDNPYPLHYSITIFRTVLYTNTFTIRFRNHDRETKSLFKIRLWQQYKFL